MEVKNTSKAYIGLTNINDLKQHELAVEEHIKELIESIKKQKIVRKPIIVDIKTGTIIDGAHRTRALLYLGVKYVPAILVDYLNENNIYVDKWLRIYNMDISTNDISYIKSIFCFDSVKLEDNIKIKLCNDNKIESYMQINKFENEFKEHIKEITFSKPNIKYRNKGGIVIDPPKLDKIDVINTASNKLLLPPRSTRHITFLKKIYLSYSLKDLY